MKQAARTGPRRHLVRACLFTPSYRVDTSAMIKSALWSEPLGSSGNQEQDAHRSVAISPEILDMVSSHGRQREDSCARGSWLTTQLSSGRIMAMTPSNCAVVQLMTRSASFRICPTGSPRSADRIQKSRGCDVSPVETHFELVLAVWAALFAELGGRRDERAHQARAQLLRAGHCARDQRISCLPVQIRAAGRAY